VAHAAQQPGPPHPQSLEKLRKAFEKPLQRIFLFGFVLISLFAVGTLVIIGIVAWQSKNPLVNVGVALRSLQMSLGMILGFFVIYLGLLASWMGIEAKYHVTGKSGSAAVTLVNASPGIVLILCGTTIFTAALLRDITADRSFSGPASLLNDSSGRNAGQTHQAPTPADTDFGK
jgi:hypothetical protein